MLRKIKKIAGSFLSNSCEMLLWRNNFFLKTKENVSSTKMYNNKYPKDSQNYAINLYSIGIVAVLSVLQNV